MDYLLKDQVNLNYIFRIAPLHHCETYTTSQHYGYSVMSMVLKEKQIVLI